MKGKSEGPTELWGIIYYPSESLGEYRKKRLAVLLLIIVASLYPASFYKGLTALLHESPLELRTALPLVERPPTDHCSVFLLHNQSFAPSVNQPFMGLYNPPIDCPPPWTKVVLDWTGTVWFDQYDHIAGLWLDRVEILRSSTPESGGLEWHVEKDVTQYMPIFALQRNVTAIVSTPSGGISVTANLTFYEANPPYSEGPHPDIVVPATRGGNPPWITLDKTTPSASVELTLPTNIVSAYLELYATGHNCDESWYSNIFVINPGCGDADSQQSYREIRVYVDSKLAGIASPYPMLYSGALDPTMWEPIPAVNALDIPPHRINLTPFAGILANDKPHAISLEVINNHNYWLISGNLLLFLDKRVSQIEGEITSHDVPLEASERTMGLSGLALTHANRSYTIGGYVDTSDGRVVTIVQQKIMFSNVFRWNLVDLSTGLKSSTTVTTVVTTMDSSGTRIQADGYSYLVNFRRWFAVRWIPLIIDQEFVHTIGISLNGLTQGENLTRNSVHAEQGWYTNARYVVRNSSGLCYDRSLASYRGVVVDNQQDGSCLRPCSRVLN